MTVITLSRQIGSRAPEVAARLCAELGLRSFDRRVIAEVASDLGPAESDVLPDATHAMTQTNPRGAAERQARFFAAHPL
jgi:hypothetical protein